VLLSFDRAAGTRQAAQLSFFVLLSFPALMLLAVWILSNIFDSPNVRQDLIQEIISNLPIEQVQGRKELEDMLDELTRGAGGLGILSVAVLLYSVSSAIGGLRHAVETANEKGLHGPSFPENKVIDIGITLVTLPVALIFVSLVLSRDLAKVVDDSVFLSWTADHLGGPAGIFAAGLAIYPRTFWALNPGRTTWSSAAVGAAVTSLLIWLIYSGLKVWFGISGGGSTVYGALAGFLGLLLFLNLASMAVVMGAHVAAIWRVHRGEKTPRPDAAAGAS
jgi:uncharacterized BrkB/YihY/UPF0761 family membrane protein